VVLAILLVGLGLVVVQAEPKLYLLYSYCICHCCKLLYFNMAISNHPLCNKMNQSYISSKGDAFVTSRACGI